MDKSSATQAPAAAPPDAGTSAAGFDTGSHESFYEYYKRQSLSPATMQRFSAMADAHRDRLETWLANQRGGERWEDLGQGVRVLRPG